MSISYISAITIVVVLLAGVLFLSWRVKLKARLEYAQARDLLNEIGSLKSLLLMVQRHRGLSSGYLNGDTSLKPAVANIAIEINKIWSALDQRYPDLKNDALCEGIREHWQRLETKWPDQEANNNIEQHNRLILNLLYFIENEAEKSAAVVRIGRQYGCDVIWKELLETIEAIGQTRAIGTGIVASGHSSAVERIRLKFLLEKVDLHLAVLESSFNKRRNSDLKLNELLKAKQSAQTLIQFVESHMSSNTLNTELSAVEQENQKQEPAMGSAGEASHNTLSSEYFFGLASAVIEPLDQLFEQALSILKSELKT